MSVTLKSALKIINDDLDREHGLVNNTIERFEDSMKRNATEMQSKAKNARHVDRFSNGFEYDNGDSEIVTMYKKILKFIFRPADIIMGIKFNYNWKPHRHFGIWFTLGNLAFACTCVIYTQCYHIKNGNTVKILEVFAVYGVAISCGAKSATYLRKFKKIQSLLEFMLKICRQNPKGRGAQILKEQFRKCYKTLKTFMVCVMLNLVLFTSVPLYGYFIKNEFISLVPAQIPFVDQSTLYGYIVANSIMSVNGLLSTFGTVFCTSTYILLISNFTTQVELIGEKLINLDEMWADKKQLLEDKRAFLEDICLRCQDINNYISHVKELFDLQIFIFFGGAYFSQIICLFEIAKNNWIPGYAIALLLFEEIMFYCYIGTQKNIANQRLYSLISDTNWYEYDIESQKILMMLLHSCQNSSELQIGPLAPMNLSTGVEIIKSIYSYYTILKELL